MHLDLFMLISAAETYPGFSSDPDPVFEKFMSGY